MKFTEEQLAVINHPQGHHARVLAVAGSGKTSTMTHRIKHLVVEQGVNPNSILILMFNRLAKQQFQERLGATGLSTRQKPKVYTFHSFAYRFINEMMRQGIIPRHIDLWTGDRSELERITVFRAIENLERRGVIRPSEIDINEALNAISLWKSFLIPTEHAGHRHNPNISAVYAEFESLRTQKNALTFDDFIPMAVELLLNNAKVNQRWCERVDYIIVDEYQDVNYGQQHLIELLAGQRADVMVVGDDDQTIYEWRGARPQYITSKFQTVFDNKPQIDYTLPHSFRFGPILAQTAYNCISQNQLRVSKPVIAHFAERKTNIHVYQMELPESSEVAKQFATQLISLVVVQNIPPNQIAVLSRLYAQLAPVEVELLSRKIPYNLIGSQPFFRRSENAALIAYIQAALHLEQPTTKQSTEWILTIANKPRRYLPRRDLETALDHGRLFQLSPLNVLRSIANDADSNLSVSQKASLAQLIEILQRIERQLSHWPLLPVGKLLRWLVDELDYIEQFKDYYGEGEPSFERQLSVEFFLIFSNKVNLPAKQYIEFLDELDPTQGVRVEQQITVTTVFQTKGLEFEYVFVPQCYEGQIPFFSAEHDVIYDTTGQIDTSEQSPMLESERRLFYVALTRARTGVFLESPPRTGGGTQLPSRFLEEMQLAVTQDVFEPYQELAERSKIEPEILLSRLQALTSVAPSMKETLQGHYLKSISDNWGKVASEIVNGLVTKPFTYQLTYRDVTNNAKPNGLDARWLELRAESEKGM